MSAQGFTAVNGLDRRESGLSPKTMPNPPTALNSRSEATAPPVLSNDGRQHAQHPSTRNDSVLYSEPVIKQSPETAKRKRLIAESIEQPSRHSPHSEEALSPKRRMTDARDKAHSNTPEGSTLSINNGERPLSMRLSTNPSNRDRCSRERSPVPTRNQRVAPPQVRPETEAHLAESLATHLQDARRLAPTSDAQSAQVPQTYIDSPPEAYSPEETGGDPSAKRKRNFSNRTKTGCHTCRQRKKKCGEEKPDCSNCLRGGFDCKGYGQKPLEYKGPNATSRAHVPLQSKVQDVPRKSPTPYQSNGARYDHWGRIPPTPTAQETYQRFPPTQSPHDMRPSQSREGWPGQPWQHHPDHPAAYNALPPVDYSRHMPASAPPPPETWRHSFHAPRHSIYGPPASVSSHGSVSTHSSRNHPPHYLPSSQISEKEKMLLGQPFVFHLDDGLKKEREACKKAVQRYNDSRHYAQDTSRDETERRFKAILDPSERQSQDFGHQNRMHPDASSPTSRGSVGSRCCIETPFTCEYGYNIHIANDVYISANCTMEDTCGIRIGSRVFVGKNVQFYGSAVSTDPAAPKGSQGSLVGGDIVVEDDVDIGAGTIIHPHRVIGKGSSIAIGSVVTMNIPPYSYAAGNPCRVIKALPRPPSSDPKRHSSLEMAVLPPMSAGGMSEQDLADEKLIAAENERSVALMIARREGREGR